MERLVDESAGPHLEELAARAADDCAALDAEIANVWSSFRKHVSDHESYDSAAEAVSFLLFDLDMLADERDEIAASRDGALARCRHAALHRPLGDAVDALPDTDPSAAAADTLKERVSALLKEDRLPAVFPDAEWEACREAAERFRATIVEPGEKELALREASRRYAEDPTAASLAALHEAAEAERARPRSLEPAAALGGIAACLGDLVGRFGPLAERARAADGIGEKPTEPPERALRAEIAEARALARDAEARIPELTAALEAAAKENDALRRDRHRLGERLAALENGAPVPAGDETVPPLESYADLPDWAERCFPGRMAFAGRALRSLKSARFEDVALVGRAVALLGTTYHRMKTEGGMELREAFEDALRELRLQETPSIRPDRQGKARDGFEIEWQGKRLALERHLKNNSGTRDPRRCLRIYFAWDEDTGKVVIGRLPGHMRT